MHKKTILIDLDGVLNNYNGDFDENHIPSIKDGAFEFLKELSKSYKITIFTTRNSFLASKWVIKNNLDKFIENVTNIKEPAHLIIDDRCINFNGNYYELKKQIDKFKVWYRDK